MDADEDKTQNTTKAKQTNLIDVKYDEPSNEWDFSIFECSSTHSFNKHTHMRLSQINFSPFPTILHFHFRLESASESGVSCGIPSSQCISKNKKRSEAESSYRTLVFAGCCRSLFFFFLLPFYHRRCQSWEMKRKWNSSAGLLIAIRLADQRLPRCVEDTEHNLNKKKIFTCVSFAPLTRALFTRVSVLYF